MPQRSNELAIRPTLLFLIAELSQTAKRKEGMQSRRLRVEFLSGEQCGFRLVQAAGKVRP